ncbi:hypothetical protein [Novosphingobium album (ex Hu et al. 2023)]|uniref:DUF4261 domain-containing protein n=1 Tax=Novosphingobium album (ex Hu et al. 2023) TaxID=2930093 RepID=A0ABT0AY68_9SPHN|nr:hypothetical protein [Novosphingobium album (ex Hu et al. 2023)]MCJ2177585.1 hypothetical protein [Novosphingobium album (ex Hu et al. 2023)]
MPSSQAGDAGQAALMLLFGADSRPAAADIARLLDAPDAGMAVRISHQPDPSEGWLELLASGLTFDLRGLSPAAPVPHDPVPHAYGFEGALPDGQMEGVGLVAAGHIAAGAVLGPVLRTMFQLAANLAIRLPVQAVLWLPAGTVMEPRYFSGAVFNWLAGGAFPALGLTALTPASDGTVTSTGLSHFIGQEMQLEAMEGEARVDSVKLAIRLVDYLVRHGPLTEPHTITQAAGELLAEPSSVGKRVWVWRAHS